MRRAALPLLAAAASAAAAGTFNLTGDAVLVVDKGASTGLGMALRDVQLDWYKVLGYSPVVVYGVPAPKSLPADTVVVVLGTPQLLPGYDLTGCLTGWESHCVKAVPAAASPSGYATVFATGQGDRGAIFAAYSFSEVLLGVHPLYRFIDQVAPPQAAVPVPEDLSRTFGPPQYAHRSIFPNDEDLTGGLHADPMGKGVFSAAAWDNMLETALRLKMNGALVGTNPLPDDDNVRLVARRGMVIHHHHYNLLGSTPYLWPLGDQDWDWRKSPGTMAYAWRAAIDAQKGYPEVVWSLGLRGLNDYSYNKCQGAPDCGRQISEVLANQTAWLEAAGQGNATKVLYLWDELLPYITSGDLVVPAGVEIIFADAGAGFIEVNSDVPLYAAGCYYHTAMYNSNANQLTEMVPVDRIVQQMLNFTKNAKSTRHAIINLSDFRPVPMTTQAWAQLVWDPTPFAAGTPTAVALQYYASWGASAYGLPPTAAQTFAAAWASYFAIPFVQGGRSDNYFTTTLQSLCSQFATAIQGGGSIPGGLVNAANGALQTLGGNATFAAAMAVLQQLEALMPSVADGRQPFFVAHSVLNAAHVAYPALATYLLASSIVELSRGGAAAKPAAQQLADAAQDAMEGLLTLRRDAEYGAWAGLYFFDHLADMQLTRRGVRRVALALAAPAGAPLAPTYPAIWYHDFEAWEVPLQPNFPKANFDPAWNMPTYVRVDCVFGDQSAGVCNNNPGGGSFVRGSAARVTLQVLTSETAPASPTGAAPALEIRYTTDGSTPTEESPSYTPGGLNLSALAAGGPSVALRAMAWINGVATGQFTDATYVAL